MIFVTLGTDHHPFDRMVTPLNELEQKFDAEVFLQSGPNDYDTEVKTQEILPFSGFQSKIREAEYVITHGGPGSILSSLNLGKIPVVVPRKEQFNEAVDNHQVRFVEFIEGKGFPIVPIYKDTINPEDFARALTATHDQKLSNVRKNEGTNTAVKRLTEITDSA